MKTLTLIAALAAASFGGTAFAGDAASGEKEFGKCKTCHGIVADDGTEIQKANKTGPNLYGVIGRQAGTVEGFKYGASLVLAGEKGLVWDETNIVEYLADPQKFLRAYLDDNKAKSNMSFKLAKKGDDVAAYLASVGPATN
ncbi:MAG: c-type cytochrome [Gemmobacter sp.]